MSNFVIVKLNMGSLRLISFDIRTHTQTLYHIMRKLSLSNWSSSQFITYPFVHVSCFETLWHGMKDLIGCFMPLGPKKLPATC